MNIVYQFLGIFRDSPTYGRDRANLITGFTIGITGLLLNGAVLMLAVPLLLGQDNPGLRRLTDDVEFGQLLALILLGGATAFATILIPFRLVTVFWEPRIGRYFDQIVLSGISPLRFTIGKVTSQNLFLGLIIFLLLPYMVLSLTLGGVDLGVFAAGLFLVWLYCMALALVTIWMSLYVNDLLAAFVVIGIAGWTSILGCIPMQFQPFVMTPFPALVLPAINSATWMGDSGKRHFLPVFASCATCMTAIIIAALIAIYLGPLYGIIRENSAFGEVIRVGDSKRKRWIQLRMHIQRSSEIAFFYANRSRTFLNHEGLFRWGVGLCGLMFVSSLVYFTFFSYQAKLMSQFGGQPLYPWFVNNFHGANLAFHGMGLALAAILFSHPKNTTYQRLPIRTGWMVEVSTFDTIAFLLFLMFSTAVSICVPLFFEQRIAIPKGFSIFASPVDPNFMQGRKLDVVRLATEGCAVITLWGIVIYALQRFVSIHSWLRSTTTVCVAITYCIFVCSLPVLFAYMSIEFRDLSRIPFVVDAAPVIVMVSPFMVMGYLFSGILGGPFPNEVSTTPFYAFHIFLLLLFIFGIRRSGRGLRRHYLERPVRETTHA